MSPVSRSTITVRFRAVSDKRSCRGIGAFRRRGLKQRVDDPRRVSPVGYYRFRDLGDRLVPPLRPASACLIPETDQGRQDTKAQGFHDDFSGRAGFARQLAAAVGGGGAFVGVVPGGFLFGGAAWCRPSRVA